MGFGKSMADWVTIPFTRPSQGYHLPQTTRLSQPPDSTGPNPAPGPGTSLRTGQDGDPGPGSVRDSKTVYGIGPDNIVDGSNLGPSALAFEPTDGALDQNRAGRDLSHIYGSEPSGREFMSRTGDDLQLESMPPMISRRNWANNRGTIDGTSVGVTGWPYNGAWAELPHQDILIDRAPVVEFVKNIDDNMVIPATYVGEVS